MVDILDSNPDVFLHAVMLMSCLSKVVCSNWVYTTNWLTVVLHCTVLDCIQNKVCLTHKNKRTLYISVFTVQ